MLIVTLTTTGYLRLGGGQNKKLLCSINQLGFKETNLDGGVDKSNLLEKGLIQNAARKYRFL